MNPFAYAVGSVKEALDTPALLIDLDALERNLTRMAQFMRGTSARLRPHAKTHKCPVIALRQMEMGAVGVCCQKVSEAEALVNGGVRNVLVSNEIVGAPKLARLAALARQAEIAVCADDARNVRQLSEAARAFGVRLPVLVEVNIGADRCGVDPGPPTLDLARLAAAQPGLVFAGLQAYQGAIQHVEGYEARRQAAQAAIEKTACTVDLLRRNGLTPEIVSGAGTGTYRFEAESGVYTEIQAGSYVFMDAHYRRIGGQGGPVYEDFEPALTVLTTVMSRPTKDRAVVDAGLKALGVDAGMPLVKDVAGVEYVRASDEHGKLVLHDPRRPLDIGDKVELIPGHCDPTVNLYDWFVGIRGGRVEAVWPIDARGCIW